MALTHHTTTDLHGFKATEIRSGSQAVASISHRPNGTFIAYLYAGRAGMGPKTFAKLSEAVEFTHSPS